MNQFLAQKTPFERGLIVFGTLWAIAKLIDAFTEDHDTVNYSLHHKKKLVYHGIAFEDRLDARLNEHSRDKVFDDCVYDDPKPRSNAAILERKRIKKDQPKYNKHHNR